MGNFSWIIIVIVIIQAIAGAVAKASEKRKAQMKLSDTPKTDSKKIQIPRPVKAASERRANQKNDLERLRAARIEALRSRSTPKQASVAKSPVPSAPKAPDIPAVAVPKATEKKVAQGSSTRAKRAERDRLRPCDTATVAHGEALGQALPG
mgnify:CR=1 FL=1